MPATNISTAVLTQATPAGLPVIMFLGDTQLDIEIIYVGTDLPQTLTVLDRVNGQDVVIGTLQRVEVLDDGRVRYRGIVTVQPRGTISPGQRQIHDIIVIDPWNNEVWAARIVMQLIDPSGYIRDAVTQERIEGAIASCYQKVGGQWVLWNADQFAQTNPQPSNFEGYYGWDVPQGEYKVTVSKSCYADAESAALTVPPPRTDVHFNLDPVGCSAVEIGDVWTTNASSIPVLDFVPGQEVATHIQVNNGEASDSTILIEWTTSGPDGQPVPALSGANTYILPPNSSIDIKVGGHLPANAEAGPYGQTTQTTHYQQTSMLISQFNVLPSPGLFLPLILHSAGGASTPTPTPTPTPTLTPTATPTPGQQTDTLTSIADSCVVQGYPTANVGDANDMWAGYDDSLNPDGEIVRSLIKFDVSGIPNGATIQNAKSRVYYVASWEFPDWVDTITVYRAQGDWQEMSVTWNNKPGFGDSYDSVDIPADESWGWRELDVQELVQTGWMVPLLTTVLCYAGKRHPELSLLGARFLRVKVHMRRNWL